MGSFRSEIITHGNCESSRQANPALLPSVYRYSHKKVKNVSRLLYNISNCPPTISVTWLPHSYAWHNGSRRNCQKRSWRNPLIKFPTAWSVMLIQNLLCRTWSSVTFTETCYGAWPLGMEHIQNKTRGFTTCYNHRSPSRQPDESGVRSPLPREALRWSADDRRLLYEWVDPGVISPSLARAARFSLRWRFLFLLRLSE